MFILLDVDECSLGLHMCHSNSQCINMPGWYYCQCRPGYESLTDDNLRAFCQGNFIAIKYLLKLYFKYYFNKIFIL